MRSINGLLKKPDFGTVLESDAVKHYEKKGWDQMSIKIEMIGGNLKVSDSGVDVDNCGNLIEELNGWLNNGWKLSGVDGGVYTLEEDKEQLCFVEYNDYVKDYHYYEIVTHATAHLFRMYYDGCLTHVELFGDCNTPGLKLNGEIEEMELESSFVNIIDLRGKTEETINLFRNIEKRTNIRIKDAILEDLSNMQED